MNPHGSITVTVKNADGTFTYTPAKDYYGGDSFTFKANDGTLDSTLNVVGTVKISGGCKNVAIAASQDGKTLFFCDQPESRIFILKEKPAK